MVSSLYIVLLRYQKLKKGLSSPCLILSEEKAGFFNSNSSLSEWEVERIRSEGLPNMGTSSSSSSSELTESMSSSATGWLSWADWLKVKMGGVGSKDLTDSTGMSISFDVSLISFLDLSIFFFVPFFKSDFGLSILSCDWFEFLVMEYFFLRSEGRFCIDFLYSSETLVNSLTSSSIVLVLKQSSTYTFKFADRLYSSSSLKILQSESLTSTSDAKIGRYSMSLSN